jgi:hypothetical protein
VSSSFNFKDVKDFHASVGFWLGHRVPSRSSLDAARGAEEAERTQSDA